jgi:hypothetical protein
MDNFYLDNNKSYNTLSYENLHKFLAKRLHVWHAKFRPAGAREEDKDSADGEIGSVASAGIITPAPAAGPAFRVNYDDNEAAPAASAAAAATAAPPTLRPPPPWRRLSDYDAQHVVHGLYKHCNLFETVSPAELLPA